MSDKPVRLKGRPRSFYNNSEKTHVRSVERAITILQALSESQAISLSEISELIGEANSTVYRILLTMEKKGVVKFDHTTQMWSIGSETFRIGNAFLSQTCIVEQSLPIMRRLMLKTNETINLAVFHKGEITFVRQVETHQPIRAFFRPGTTGVGYASGIGKAVLAYISETQLHDIIDEYDFHPFTKKTIMDKEELIREIKKIKKRGWSVDNEEHTIGMRCIAAPIFNYNHEAIAGISISGPSVRVTSSRFPELGNLVAEAADEITKSVVGHSVIRKQE